MRYEEAVRESRKVLAEGIPDVPIPLSRRKRVAPVDVHIDGRVAAVMFATRPKRARPELGEVDMTILTFESVDGEWVELGASGGTIETRSLNARPTAAARQGRYLESPAVSWGTRPMTRWYSLRRRAIGDAHIRASAEVEVLRIRGRTIPVRVHGHHVIVWSARHGPKIEAWGAGKLLEVLDLSRHRLPPRFVFTRRRQCGWRRVPWASLS